jgi:hypothetical protein
MKLQILLSGLLFVGFVGCGDSQKSNSAATVTATAQPAPKPEWITFYSPDAPYTVLLPGEPIKRSQMTTDGILNKYICMLNNDLALMTCDTDVRDTDRHPVNLANAEEYNFCFDAAMKAAVDEARGNVTEQETFFLQKKFPTRAFTATYNTPQVGIGMMQLRLILTEKKLIQLMIAGTAAEIQKPETKKFLDSIKIQE